jgi:hypothetical protein
MVTARVADPDPYEYVFLGVGGAAGYMFGIRVRPDLGFKFSFEF